MRSPIRLSDFVQTRAITTFFLLSVSMALYLVASEPYAQISAGSDVDLSQNIGPEVECAITKNPSNNNQLFAACNSGSAGLFAVRSADGGYTWTYPDPADKAIADGDAGQGPEACCDPTLAWDSFGNLYVGYLTPNADSVVILLSTDNGVTFTTLQTFPGSVDQPTVVAENTTDPGAPVALWVVWNQSDSMHASGAAVTGLGAVAFSATQIIPGTSSCTFGDVAIAPSGVVVQACQHPNGDEGPTSILINVDADGLGGNNFGNTMIATTTNVGTFEMIPPTFYGSVTAEAGLAYDRFPTSPHFGRLYLVYTEETANENNDTDIMLRFSDDDGASWSDPPIRVNDDPATPIRSQFLPRIASDPLSGNIAVCWHDARNSSTNTAMQEFCSIATPAGVTPVFSANVAIGDALSTSTDPVGLNFGDYSGLAYMQGGAHPIWADTSNSTLNNPDGASDFDAYTDRVNVGTGTDECDPCIPSAIIDAIFLIILLITILLIILGWIGQRTPPPF